MATPSGLARRLGTTDAVLIGLGSRIGAGVFAVFAPAAHAAGRWLLVAVLVAVVDLRGAIGFSSFGGAALLRHRQRGRPHPAPRREPATAPRPDRRTGRVLAVSLPSSAVITGAAVIGIGALLYAARRFPRDRST